MEIKVAERLCNEVISTFSKTIPSLQIGDVIDIFVALISSFITSNCDDESLCRAELIEFEQKLEEAVSILMTRRD